MIRTYDEFHALLNESGFMLLGGAYGRLSLTCMTDPAAWHTGGELDPWGWKDRMAQSRDGAYAHMFGGQAGFVSRQWYSTFFAAYSADIEYEYAAGLVPGLSMDMWRLFCERPVWGRHELRRALAGRFERKSAFDSALRYLERGMLITVSGNVQPLSDSGRPIGWQAMEYTRADAYLGDWLTDAEQDGRCARQMICNRALELSPELNASELKRLFGSI